jgi:hypothetical protein
MGIRNYCEFIILVLENMNWWMAFTLLAIIAILLLVRKTAKKKKELLSSKVKKAKSEFLQPNIVDKLQSLVTQLYYPSFNSLLAMFILFSPILLLSLYSPKTPEFNGSNQYRNLITIEAGLAAVIFPVIIFIIGLSGSKVETGIKRSEVLLRESYIFPVALFVMLSLVNFIWLKTFSIGIIVVLITAFFSIFTLYRIIRILLNDYTFLQKSIALMKDKVRRSIDLAVEERLGNNILLDSLGEGKIELEYSFSHLKERKDDFHFFKGTKLGIVKDINLKKLNEFGKVVEEESNRNESSFYKNKTIITSEIAVQDFEEAKKKVLAEDKEKYIKRRFRDQITDGDEEDVVLCVSKKGIKDPRVLKKLENLSKQIFFIKPDDKVSEKLRIELSNLKDEVIQDIRERRLGRLFNLRKVYIALSEVFLETMKQYGSSYSLEQARREGSSILGGWNEVRWILDDIEDIYTEAMQSHDQNIIADIAHLPVAISTRAIGYLDHYIFREFLRFQTFLYISALEETDSKLKNVMLDRSWRYLKEIVTFYIEPYLRERRLDRNMVPQYKDFGIGVLFVFQDLMKRAYDKKDLESFKQFNLSLDSLFERFHPSLSHPNTKHYEWELEHLQLSAEQRKEVQTKLEYQQIIEGAEKEINLRRKQLLFGLASWILYEYRNNPRNGTIIKFYEEIHPFFGKDVASFSELYLSCYSFKTEHFWDWERWEIIPDGEVREIDILGKLVWFYYIKSLQMLSEKSDEEIEKIELPFSRNLGNEEGITKILSEIKNNEKKWPGIVSNNAIKKIPKFLDLLKKAKRKQQQEEEDTLIKSSLNGKKIDEFVDSFKNEFYNEANLRKIIDKYGNYINQTKIQVNTKKLKLWGYNQLDEKAAFIENWYMDYSRWGEQYGNGLAQSENVRIFKEIADDLSNCQAVKETEIISSIERATQQLKKQNINPNIILASLDLDELRMIRESRKFIPKWDPKCLQIDINNYLGTLKINSVILPVFRIHTQKNENIICILEVKKLGKLIQYAPYEKEEDKKYQQGIFYIHIRDLNEDNALRKKIIEKNPDWLNKHRDKEHYLKQKVIINIYEKFEFKVERKNAGYKLVVRKDNNR